MGTLAAKVIYDPFALGDRSYNDLIYQGVEEAAARHARLPFECSPVREPVPQRTRRIYTLP